MVTGAKMGSENFAGTPIGAAIERSSNYCSSCAALATPTALPLLVMVHAHLLRNILGRVGLLGHHVLFIVVRGRRWRWRNRNILVKGQPTTTAGSFWFCCKAKARTIMEYYGRQSDDENQAAQNALEANCENSFGGPTTKKKTSLWCYLFTGDEQATEAETTE
jgi:hypothetical protein